MGLFLVPPSPPEILNRVMKFWRKSRVATLFYPLRQWCLTSQQY